MRKPDSRMAKGRALKRIRTAEAVKAALRLLISNRRTAESSGNFVPKRDLTRYCNATRDCSCNGTTVCRTLCWPISHHSV